MKLFGKSDKTVTVSNETILRVIFLTVAAFLFMKFIGEVTHQLTLIAVAGFLAIALNPAVNWITKRLKSRSRIRATGVAYIIVLGLLITFLATVVPPLVQQTTDFLQDVPQTIDDFRTQDSAVARLVRQYELDNQLGQISNDLSSRIGDLSKPAFSAATRIVGSLISIITVLVLTFMILMEGPLWYKRLMSIQPADKRKHRDQIAKKMYQVVTGYVNGQVLLAAIAAGFALITLLIASTLTDATVNAVALAGIVFIFGLIPLIGNILASVIVVLFALFASPTLALIMAVYFVLYQQIENVTLQPYIQSRTNEMTPLTVFVAALLGVGLGGLLGALAAIPIAGSIQILVEDKLRKELPDRGDIK